ncbi:hypothetical protein JZ751_010794 [Albula glossodonta]|uniref:Uncharacterized protein n=1 Tax=Albula glossodonta TaxID=121402 RepID=A0A8T2N505_9TELE|nr:hypothetical protein JZ751_010794 [Albula glossodonta]
MTHSCSARVYAPSLKGTCSEFESHCPPPPPPPPPPPEGCVPYHCGAPCLAQQTLPWRQQPSPTPTIPSTSLIIIIIIMHFIYGQRLDGSGSHALEPCCASQTGRTPISMGARRGTALSETPCPHCNAWGYITPLYPLTGTKIHPHPYLVPLPPRPLFLLSHNFRTNGHSPCEADCTDEVSKSDTPWADRSKLLDSE